jgi:hypothetical protein
VRCVASKDFSITIGLIFYSDSELSFNSSNIKKRVFLSGAEAKDNICLRIKNSEDADIIRHGISQLWLRLAIMGYALNILYPEPNCNLIGNLFIPKIDFTITRDDSFIYSKRDTISYHEKKIVPVNFSVRSCECHPTIALDLNNPSTNRYTIHTTWKK